MITSLSSQLDERIRANSGAIEKLQEDVTSLGGQVATQAQTILNHATSIQNNAKQIEQNAADIVTNGNDHDAIRTLIQANQEAIEENASAIAANKKAIEEANLSISAEDVAKNTASIARNLQMISKNAEDIASHAELIAKNASGIADNSSAISANATDIASLRSDLNTAKNTLTEEYLQAIQTAISTLDGKLSGEISQKVSKINSDITSLQTSTNSRLSALESRANTLEANVISIQASIASIREDIARVNKKIENIVSRIQSITYLPIYTDGKAKITPHDNNSGDFSFTLEADFEVMPHQVADEIIEQPSVLSAKAIIASTKSDNLFTNMSVLDVYKREDGVIHVSLDFQPVHQAMSIGQFPVFSLAVSNDIACIQSEFVDINLGIVFYDSKTKKALLSKSTFNIDLDADGEISYLEAARIDDLPKLSRDIQYFDEFKYFTGIKRIAQRLKTTGFDGSSIISIILPRSVTTIDSEAFYGCKDLKSLSFHQPASCESIVGDDTFREVSMDHFIVPKSVTTVSHTAFNNSQIHKLSFEQGSKLNATTSSIAYVDTVVIPNTCYALGTSFLKSVNGIKMTVIFEENSHITTFEQTGDLNDVHLPASITTIKLCHCQNLYIPKKNPPKFSKSTLYSGSSFYVEQTLFVPYESIGLYQDAIFNAYGSAGRYGAIAGYSF